MRNVEPRILLRNAATGVILAFLASTGLLAQSSGPRTLEELKAETQKRVDRNVAPAGGLKSEDAREALTNETGRTLWGLLKRVSGAAGRVLSPRPS